MQKKQQQQQPKKWYCVIIYATSIWNLISVKRLRLPNTNDLLIYTRVSKSYYWGLFTDGYYATMSTVLMVFISKHSHFPWKYQKKFISGQASKKYITIDVCTVWFNTFEWTFCFHFNDLIFILCGVNFLHSSHF